MDSEKTEGIAPVVVNPPSFIPPHRRDYSDFLASKRLEAKPAGFDPGDGMLNPNFAGDFIWQNDTCRWALKRGRAGIFPDTGLGKSILQLVIAEKVVEHTGGKFLLLAPLAVSNQTLRESQKFGIKCNVKVCSDQMAVEDGITITNYQKLHRFDISQFVGVGLDEASILKSADGKTRDKLIEEFQQTPYRYAFTATPSPNDIMELGSYCEFLGIMTRSEMLSMFFVHDGGDTSKWRLKKHAEKSFFRWMATWAIMINNPSDIGYDGSRFILPPLNYHIHTIESEPQDGYLFSMPAKTLGEQRASRRETITQRVEALAEIVNSGDEPWSIWCQLNDESKAAAKEIRHCVEVTGSMKDWEKEQGMIDFTTGVKKRIVSKAAICGHGMNWQHCCKVGLLGIDHSYERLYQLIRRHYRFGQVNPVDVHAFISDRDGDVLANMDRKHKQHESLVRGMIEAVSEQTRQEIHGATRERSEYEPAEKLVLPSWI